MAFRRVFIRINGRTHYIWREVDQEGDVLDVLVQSKRNKKAARRFFRKLLKGLRYVPRVIITDKLKIYRAEKAELTTSTNTPSVVLDGVYTTFGISLFREGLGPPSE